MTDKQFKVGQWWRTSGGYKVFIDTILHDQIISGCGRTYDLGGRYSLQRDWDLVTLIEDVENVPTAEPKYEKCEGCGHVRGYCTLGHKCNCGAYYKPLTEDVPPAKTEAKPLFHVGQEGVTTRDGRKVRILCDDLKDKKPIVAALSKEQETGEEVVRYYATGRFTDLDDGSYVDLIPPPPPKQYAWMYVYKDPEGNLLGGNPHRIKVPNGHVSASSGGAVGYICVELAERWDE